MKLKRLTALLCIFTCFCLLLCGCGKRFETENQSDGEISEVTESEPTESNSPIDRQPVKQASGSASVDDLANHTFLLNPNNFLDFFHYRIESTDKGGEYDVLTYSLELNASSDGIAPYVEGISAGVAFDVEIKYVKEYTENGYIYDTFTYSCLINGHSDAMSGTIDIEQIPVFKRSETDSDHKKFTVLSAYPSFPNIAGIVSYDSFNHTYKEAVTFDTAPGFDIVANDDCIAVYMVPNGDYLYDDLAVEIEIRYTDDTTGKPDRFIRYEEERVTIEGNLGGYGQYYHKIENGAKVSKVVVSVVGVSGSVIRPKGYTVFDAGQN